ncbi:MAG: cyclodeaminase/cyclohydrolase family protein [Candidatus Omnitrophota bacterium]|nr:MAG: cyclodeaminase/cyclohydrolase family protein [Candidatus Omnitrophota bacterium]
MYAEVLKKYLDDLASTKPAPGGGSAAALTGAIAVALLAKVANFTIGKEKYKRAEEEMKNILKQSQELVESLNDLCLEDAKAYKKFSDAVKLPKGPKRQEKLQEALKEATSVPVQVCKDTHQAIKFCLPLAVRGNRNLITDAAIGAMMLECAFQSALLNVEINLKSIKDNDFVLKIREVLEPMEEEISLIVQEVKTETEKYLSK